jgi:hypothetical protein
MDWQCVVSKLPASILIRNTGKPASIQQLKNSSIKTMKSNTILIILGLVLAAIFPATAGGPDSLPFPPPVVRQQGWANHRAIGLCAQKARETFAQRCAQRNDHHA